MTVSKVTCLYRTPKISLSKENLCFGKPGSSVGYTLYKIFLRILENSSPNTTLKSISFITVKFSLQFLKAFTEETDLYKLAEGKIVCLSKRNGKQNQHRFNHGPNITLHLQTNGITYLRTSQRCQQTVQFSFKPLHRILVTKNALKRYKIKPNHECFFLQRSRFPQTHIPGLLCCRGLLLRNDDMVQQRTEFQFNITKQQIRNSI